MKEARSVYDEIERREEVNEKFDSKGKRGKEKRDRFSANRIGELTAKEVDTRLHGIHIDRRESCIVFRALLHPAINIIEDFGDKLTLYLLNLRDQERNTGHYQ